MGGKRGAQPSGSAQDPPPSAKRQTRASAEETHCGAPEETLETLTVTFSTRCNARALSREALESSLRNWATGFGGRELGGREFRLGRINVGPSNDTLQRVLPFVVEYAGPEAIFICVQASKTWFQELGAQGLCLKTLQLCSTLAQGGKHERLSRHMAQMLGASTGAERALYMDTIAFLQRSWLWRGDLREWLQAASQEPDASFLSRGGASTATMLGFPLVQWVAKPQERYPGFCTLTGHSAAITSVAFSPDGKCVVSGSTDNLVKIWNAETGAEVATLIHVSQVHSVAFSPDGKWIVSGSSDQLVKIWNAETGTELRTLAGHLESVCAVSFSPDGKRIISGSLDHLVKIWNAETGAEIHSLGHTRTGKCKCVWKWCEEEEDWEVDPTCPVMGHFREVSSVSFSPDGKRVVSGSDDGFVKIWDAETGEQVCSHEHQSSGSSVDFSPDGKKVVIASYDDVAIWDTDTGTEVCVASEHSYAVTPAKFSPDGKWIVCGSGDQLVKIWDVETGAEVRTLTGHSDKIQTVAISPDGRRIVSGSADKLVKIWNAETGPEVCNLTVHYDAFVEVVSSRDGRRVLSKGHEQVIKLWNAETGAQLWSSRTHDGKNGCICRPKAQLECPVAGHSVTRAEFSPDGKCIVTASIYSRLVKIWDAETGVVVRTIGHTGSGSCICTGKDGEVNAIDSTCNVAGHAGWVDSVTWSPDGKCIVSGSTDKLLKVWDAATGAEVWTSRTHDFKDGCICTRNSWGGAQVNAHCPVTGHARRVRWALFSPDGKRIVSVDDEGLAKIWDAATGAEVCTLTGHSGWVWSTSFSPDGKHIVSGAADRLVKLWDAETGAEVWTSRCHSGKDGCLCSTNRPFGDNDVIQPECPVRGHAKLVSRVQFSDDGQQVISSSHDYTVRFWDVASGKQVRQVAGSNFAFVRGATTKHHFLTVNGNKLRIIDLQPHAGPAATAPVASFIAPYPILGGTPHDGGGASVLCHDHDMLMRICVGCFGGCVCFLQAPFLAA